MEQNTCQGQYDASLSYPDFTTDLETSNLRPTHQESTNQPLAQQPPQAPSNSQYGYTPNLINLWPFPCEDKPWAPQSMACDSAASQPLTTEPAMATSPQATTALYKQGGLGDAYNPQDLFPLLLMSPEQSCDLFASLGLGVDGAMAAPPVQGEITPPMPWTRPSFTARDESMGLSTQSGSVTAERPSQEDYNGTSGPEAGIVGPQKQMGGAVEELCQLEGRLQYLNKQQMSFVKDSFNSCAAV